MLPTRPLHLPKSDRGRGPQPGHRRYPGWQPSKGRARTISDRRAERHGSEHVWAAARLVRNAPPHTLHKRVRVGKSPREYVEQARLQNLASEVARGTKRSAQYSHSASAQAPRHSRQTPPMPDRLWRFFRNDAVGFATPHARHLASAFSSARCRMVIAVLWSMWQRGGRGAVCGSTAG